MDEFWIELILRDLQLRKAKHLLKTQGYAVGRDDAVVRFITKRLGFRDEKCVEKIFALCEDQLHQSQTNAEDAYPVALLCWHLLKQLRPARF
jgi:hypothetical protein